MNKLVIFFVLSLLIGCKGTKSISTLTNMSEDIFYQSLDKKLNVPIKFKFKGQIDINNSNHRIKGNIKVFSEDELYIQLISSSLGIEISRLHFFNDSMIFLNRIEKKYYEGLVNNFNLFKDFESNDIIRLISANSFIFDTNFVGSYDESVLLNYKNLGYEQYCTLNENLLVKNHKIELDNNSIVFDFNDFKKGVFPEKLNINMNYKGLIIGGFFDLFEYQNIKGNSSIKINVPKVYKSY